MPPTLNRMVGVLSLVVCWWSLFTLRPATPGLAAQDGGATEPLLSFRTSIECWTKHVNEQPHEYWIAKFEALGYHRDEQLVATWQAGWEAGGIPAYYYRNLMVFRWGQFLLQLRQGQLP